MRFLRFGSAVAIGAAALLRAPDAAACSIAAPSELVIDAAEQAVDHTAPGPPSAVTVSLQRGRAPQSSGCGETMSTSCDDLGFVTFFPKPPADDRTASAELGYRVRLVGGSLPSEATLWPKAIVAGAGGGLTLTWIDGANDDQEPLDFTVTLAAVDRAGNEGPPSAPVHVVDAGTSGGCRTGRSGDAGSATVLLAVLLGVRVWRRRGRR